jgi:SAM-dependent methyltransferase
MIDTLPCPLCSSRNLHSKPFGYLFKDQWLGAIECKNCRIIFIRPQPTGQEIESLYSKEYFEHDFRCGHAGSYYEEAALEKLGEDALLEQFRQFKNKGSLLEIGCAGGAFLNNVRKAGYEVHGVELSPEAAQLARERYNLNVHVGDLLSAKYPDGMFDIVYMGDVLASSRSKCNVTRD